MLLKWKSDVFQEIQRSQAPHHILLFFFVRIIFQDGQVAAGHPVIPVDELSFFHTGDVQFLFMLITQLEPFP